MTSAEEVLAHYKSEWETKIRNMKPGRELDALVAEKVMGWTYGHPCPEGMDCLHWADEKGKVRDYKPPQYSTDIAAAWEVVEKMSEQWPQYQLAKIEDGWSVMWGFDGYGWPEATGKTAPEAICKAALLAVTEE